MANPKIQVQQYKQRQKKVSKLLYDDQTLFLITPPQVLVISLIFIANVFILHIVSRFIPSSSGPQVALSIVVVILSLLVTFVLNKKQ